MKGLKRVFSDWLTRVATGLFLLVLAVTYFDVYSQWPQQYPLFGVALYSAVPMLFVGGGVVFVLAILRGWASRPKLMLLMSEGAASLILLVIASYQLVEFSDTAAFCGRLCHNVMYPEFTAYQASPHSRVRCADCHVGSGADYLVKSKLSGVPLIFATIADSYDRPIKTPVRSLRPARETCEQCHRPERFTGNLVLERTTYAPDEKNTSKTDVRILRVGGGLPEAPHGIHWHVATTVNYLPLDEARQDIAWVRADTADGPITYSSPGKDGQATPERIRSEGRLMDCVDCHNRATHQFNSPETLLNAAFSDGRLDPSLPFLKREALRALDPPNSSLEEAYSKADAIADFYRTGYPDVYLNKRASVDAAVRVTRGIAVLTTFPDMRVTWKTYLSNVGHIDSPGCFRCHGKLVAQDGPRKGQTVSADCTLCHYFGLQSLSK